MSARQHLIVAIRSLSRVVDADDEIAGMIAIADDNAVNRFAERVVRLEVPRRVKRIGKGAASITSPESGKSSLVDFPLSARDRADIDGLLASRMLIGYARNVYVEPCPLYCHIGVMAASMPEGHLRDRGRPVSR